MYISTTEIQAGDIPIDHGLLTTSLLFDKKTKLDEWRLLDFINLVSVLTLRDGILTLPAIIPQSVRDSRFYKYLQEGAILYELDF